MFLFCMYVQEPLGSIRITAEAQPIYNMEKDQRLIRHRQATSHHFCEGEHGKRNRRKLCQENDAGHHGNEKTKNRGCSVFEKTRRAPPSCHV